jgi:4-amino-4-deoxy-L-arabinose transferase-like glycosyltransferase
VALLVGAALRLYPLHRPFIHPDQELLPMHALAMLVAGDWRPTQLTYPSGFLYLLRASYDAVLWWDVSVRGAVRDAAELFARYLGDPFSLNLVARLWSCAFGIATIPLTACLGARLAGRRAGSVAALIVATSFLAVRESHYGSGDAAATALFVATLVATAEILRQRGATMPLVAGLLAGLTAGFRYQLGLVAFGVALAVALRRERAGWRARLLVLAGAGAAALLAFAVTTPYSLLESARAWADVARQLGYSYHAFGTNVPLVDALGVAVGWTTCLLALGGTALALWRRPGLASVLLLVSLPYAAGLWHSTRPFVRYALPLVPVLALFAAAALDALAALAPRRWSSALLVVLALATVAEPLARAIALDRLLARDDTRTLAAAWLLEHVAPGERVWLPAVLPYPNPALPLTPGFVAFRCGQEIGRAVARYATDVPGPPQSLLNGRSDQVAAVRRGGGLVVTADHPGLGAWAQTPPEVRALLAEHATRVATFTGIDPARAGDALFEWIDANFVPLRGQSAVDRPGPNLEIWRVTPES